MVVIIKAVYKDCQAITVLILAIFKIGYLST